MARTVENEEALVLRAIAYGEADRVVTLLCAEEGKVAALAKGARRSQRRFAGGLGLLSLGRATFVERQGAELARFERFEVSAMWPGVLADLGKIAHAGYAAELVDALVPPRQPDPPIFSHVLAFMRALNAGEARAGLLRVFELGLLGLLGMRPELERCVVCGRPASDGPGQRVDPQRGGIACGTCRAEGPLVDAAARGALLAAQQTALPEAASLTSTPEVARTMRVALQAVLASHLHRELKSIAFIEKLNQPTP